MPTISFKAKIETIYNANSDMFKGMLARELKQQGVKEYIKLHELPACVTVDDSGFLAKITINL